MKEFMLIFLGADYQDLGLSPEESQAQMQKWMAWVDDLRKKDLYVEGRPLHAPIKRLKSAEDVPTDGPFAESKELVGGYFIIKSESMEKAIDHARHYPDFHLGGSVEVREVMMMDQA